MKTIGATVVITALACLCAVMAVDLYEANNLLAAQRASLDGLRSALDSLRIRAERAEAVNDRDLCLLGRVPCPASPAVAVGGE